MMHTTVAPDGVHARAPRSAMSPAIRKMWDTYERVPDAPYYRREFGFFALERWKEEGMPPDVPLAELFGFDEPAQHSLGQLGWCEAPFHPQYEVKIVEYRGDYEVEQDAAGRHVLFFAGRRSGFMPEYIGHPVRDQRTWEENALWRLDPTTPSRYADLEERMAKARAAAARGMMIVQNVVGGFMYLRSLMGPEEVLYAFHDMPELIHACMRAWLAVVDAVIARHQRYVTLDQLFLAEDICYNHGPLIAPAMMRRFLFPYYEQLIANIRARQIDRDRHLYIQVDTDGYAVPVIPVYAELGLDVMCPFEVASGCDVVQVGRQYPGLVITGGIDKRVLAQGRAAIDRHLAYILPAMRARGGYIPTCDHGVPPEVPYADYLYYRQRCIEMGG